MKKNVAAIFFILISFVLSACDCNENSYINIENADIVFVGKVIKIKEADVNKNNQIKFEIFSFNKGEQKKNKIIVGVPCLCVACCGISFERGKKYKVFAIYRANKLTTNLCSQTHLINSYE